MYTECPNRVQGEFSMNNAMEINVTTRKPVTVTLEQLGFEVKKDNNGNPMVYKFTNPQSSILGAVYLQGVANINGEKITTIDTLRIPIVNAGNGDFVGGIRYQDKNDKWRDHVRINKDFSKLILNIWAVQTMGKDATVGSTEAGEVTNEDPFINAPTVE